MSEMAIEDQDDQYADDGGAAREFANLRAEVAALRRAVEGLAPPDYAPSFGILAKTLGEVEERLAGVEECPALQLTPEQHARAIERAGAGIVREAARALRDEADAVRRERENLGRIVGAAATQEAHKRARLWMLGAGAAAGLVLFPLLGAFAPGGSYLAAWATGHSDRWQAGADLMHAADAAGAQSIARASRLVNANAEALQNCAEAAKKAGKEQKCAINVGLAGGQ